MSFDLLALAILFFVWAVFGCLSWLAVALRRRGRGMLALLPPAMAGGIGSALLVPAIGLRDVPAVLLSLLAALLGGLALTLAGVYARRVGRKGPTLPA